MFEPERCRPVRERVAFEFDLVAIVVEMDAVVRVVEAVMRDDG